MNDTFDRILNGLEEAASHAAGNTVPGVRLHPSEPLDVAAIRRVTGLSQSEFARRVGVALPTLRNWEQGRRTPEGPARVLLAMLHKNPFIVEETLGSVR